MNVLSVDCSSGVRVILKKDNQIYTVDNKEMNRQSDGLLKVIDSMLSSANLDIKNIDTIAVCVGPGSFTGIRVAISVCKALAIGTDCKIITFNSFEALEVSENTDFAIVLDGFGSNFYYFAKLKNKELKGCNTLDEIIKLVKDCKILSTSENVVAAFRNSNVISARYNPIKFIEKKISDNEYTETNTIMPLYLRASQAEIEREKRGKN